MDPKDPHPQGLEQFHPNLVLGFLCHEVEPRGCRGGWGGSRSFWLVGDAAAVGLLH